MKLPCIKKILETRAVGVDAGTGLTNLYIKVKNPPLLDLIIEGIEQGPNGYPAISICHCHEQNGDLVQEPEMTFEIHDGEFLPYSLQQPHGVYREVYLIEDGVTKGYYPRVQRELERIAREWDRNLNTQGFLSAALKGVNP